MEQLKSNLRLSETTIRALRAYDERRAVARKRADEYLAQADSKRAAAEAKRARKRAKNIAIAERVS
jgi:hypothetical protein